MAHHTITTSEKEVFDQQGFLVVRQVFSAEEVLAIKDRLAYWISRALSGLKEGQKPEGDTVSCEGVLVQLEPLVAQGKVSVSDPLKAARKIWNFVAPDAFFWKIASDPRLLDRVAALLGPDIKLYADKALLKPPEIGVEKPWHQDAPYFAIEPKENAHVAAWIALDKATKENGCMEYLPGSHRWGNLTTTTTDTYGLGHLAADATQLDTSQAVTVEADPGDVVFHEGMVLHYSGPNRSPQPRWALIFDYVSARCRYTGPEPKPSYPLLRGKEYPDGL
ncbi:MAG: phytanoyl-CoA dioxygenase family protein [Armatimonadetes bacterium]|nr:phytanoyl-CoA dioxygenase family protein [Armatimonadota bacterium]MDW8122851.1 phytanoyl-CoA dioxygenase family protein [Armatimonadota bacterium]